MAPTKPPRKPVAPLGSEFGAEPDLTDIATSLQPSPWTPGELDHPPYQEDAEGDTHSGTEQTQVPLSNDLDQSGETVMKPIPMPAYKAEESYGFADTLIRQAPEALDRTQLDGPAAPAPLAFSFGPRYRGRRVLGTTPMGTAFEAEEINTGRRVRIEVLVRRAQPGLPPGFEEARRIALSSSALKHPGIIEVLDLEPGEDRTGPLLISEWFDGSPLRARLAAGPMSIEEVCVLGATLADTLAAAHSNGLVHGGLNADSVWGVAGADPNVRQVRVLGFGLARLDRPFGQGDPMADIRALGALLLEALGSNAMPDLHALLLRAAAPDSGIGLSDLRASLLSFLGGPAATPPPPSRTSFVPLVVAFLAALALAFGVTRLYLAYQHQQAVMRIESLVQPPK